MLKFIFHGGAPNDVNVDSWYRFLDQELPEGVKILNTYFAVREEWDKAELKRRIGLQDQLFAKYLPARINELAIQDSFIAQLSKSDVVFFHGGDTFHLLKQLSCYKNLHQHLENKLVIGTSAGAYAFAKYFYSNDESRIASGLGYAPVNLICHYRPEKHGSIISDLAVFQDNTLPLYALPEGVFVMLSVE